MHPDMKIETDVMSVKTQSTLMRMQKYGIAQQPDGTLLLGHVPYVEGIRAWFHVLFAPLQDDKLKLLERRMGMPIPEVYQKFFVSTMD